MNRGVEPALVDRFRAAVTARLGLIFDDTRTDWLAEVLRHRVVGKDPVAYVAHLESDAPGEEVARLAGDLTIAETYFLRNANQYRALAESVLPRWRSGGAARTPLRMLSLGCASGEEAYSLAMVTRDALGALASDVSIVAVDVNPTMIARARTGRFSAWALRDMSETDRQRYFRTEGRDFVLDDAVRASVRFEQRNLVDDDAAFWQLFSCDVVFCRNVLMYFSREQAEGVLRRIERILRPGGHLFLGHAETLRGLSDAFEVRNTQGAFYYQRKGDPVVRPADVAPLDVSWTDVIRGASERVAALTQPQFAKAQQGLAPARSSSPVWDLQHAMDLLRAERFNDALAIVDGLPRESGRDVDVLLLLAALLIHTGQLAEAADACSRLLATDVHSAGAHHLLAVCRAGAADLTAATYHGQRAISLDPGFAMARLHLGMLARRHGDSVGARRELSRALVLLPREDAGRVLLFGGGFGRDALMALCRTQLAQCGGKP